MEIRCPKCGKKLGEQQRAGVEVRHGGSRIKVYGERVSLSCPKCHKTTNVSTSDPR